MPRQAVLCWIVAADALCPEERQHRQTWHWSPPFSGQQLRFAMRLLFRHARRRRVGGWLYRIIRVFVVARCCGSFVQRRPRHSQLSAVANRRHPHTCPGCPWVCYRCLAPGSDCGAMCAATSAPPPNKHTNSDSVVTEPCFRADMVPNRGNCVYACLAHQSLIVSLCSFSLSLQVVSCAGATLVCTSA